MITETELYRRAFADAQSAFVQGMKRHKKRLTLTELAAATYVCRDQVRNILRGKGGTSMTTILDLAAFLGVSPAVFFPRGKE